ncbi:MAG: RNA polymerase sigma factor [Candidatus Doudnabacteria bacterium]|nr:RNA polymerase sigma factor [Candidatus Doudnabacteria bacterium]
MNNFSETQIKGYAQAIFRYAFSRLSNKSDAEDVVQETFARAFSRQAALAAATNVEAWLIGIARNILLESYRAKARLVTSLNEEDNGELNIPDDSLEAEVQVIESELLELIKKELKGLDVLTQEIVELRVWENLKFSEIAEIVGQSELLVKKRYYRGIEELAAKLNNRNHKKRVIALPVLLHGLRELSYQPELQLDNAVANNLIISLRTMESSAVSSGSIWTRNVNPKLAYSILGVVVVSVVALFIALMGSVNTALDNAQTSSSTSSTRSVSTSTLTTTSSESSTSSSSTTSSEDSQVVLKNTLYPRYPAGNPGQIIPSGTKIEITVKVPAGFTFGEQGNGLAIKDAEGVLLLGMGIPYEGFDRTLESYEKVGVSSLFGDMYRVVPQSAVRQVNYTNRVILEQPGCSTGDDYVTPPCSGSSLSKDTGNGDGFGFVMSCHDETRLALCDEIALSLTAVGIKY